MHTSELHPKSRIRLNDGHAMPIWGFGTYLAQSGLSTVTAVEEAIRCDYRLIDTAAIYENEADVGIAIQNNPVSRDELFITTKLWNDDQGYDASLRAFDISLKKLQLSFIDLYLLHWPVKEKRIESYKALAALKDTGKCRSIGVSNFMVHHLQELIDATGIIPAVNQIEVHPFLYQRDLIDFCKNNGIVVQSYAPLTAGHKLDHPFLRNVAEKNQKTPAQILLRWQLQHQLVPLPKSIAKERIEENALIFDFTLELSEMAALDALDENFHSSWDPTHEP